jgi:hypothetical protein
MHGFSASRSPSQSRVKYPIPNARGAREEPSAAPAVAPAEKIEVPLSANPTAEEMRERVLRKYTSGLR